MKTTNFYALLFVLAFVYSAYGISLTAVQNRAPYTLTCKGIRLDTGKVITLTNKPDVAGDTIAVRFEQSAAIMPPVLAYIYFNKAKGSFVLRNSDDIAVPGAAAQSNPFLPFARTLHDSWYQRANYFGAGQELGERQLLTRGVKYNTAAGGVDDRVAVTASRFRGATYLNVKDQGIGISYIVESGKENGYIIAINQPVADTVTPRDSSAKVFSFQNPTLPPGQFMVHVQASAFKATYTLNNGRYISHGGGEKPTFTAGPYLFELTPKFPVQFFISLGIFLTVIIAFQVYFLRLLAGAASPVIRALLSIRLLVNCVALMAVPLFITAYFQVSGRIWYLWLILLLNASFFIPKTLLHKIDLATKRRYLVRWAWGLALTIIVIMALFTRNENVWGVIPVLHVQKIVLLLLVYASQPNDKPYNPWRYWLRLFFLLVCSLVMSRITGDFGSFLYSIIAFAAVELIKKNVRLGYAVFSLLGLACIVYLLFLTNPDFFAKGKLYRLVASYTPPGDEKLTAASQADRETYSNIFLVLKNIIQQHTPMFNNLLVPGFMRSTSHSDLAFLWSFGYGGFYFIGLYLLITWLLIANLQLLLFCAIRQLKIRQGTSFVLPASSEAELVRYLLAFTAISFVYPIASNLLVLPLTGQSIPVLSISNGEIIFLTFLVVSVNSIFTNDKYIAKNKEVSYHYGDARISMRYAMVVTTFCIVLVCGCRCFLLLKTDDFMSWKKQAVAPEDSSIPALSSGYQKDTLITMARAYIGPAGVTAVAAKKKVVLKKLASLYFTGYPYSGDGYSPPVFSNSSARLLSLVSYDSLLRFSITQVSGSLEPFGKVFAYRQLVNGKPLFNVTNSYYRNYQPFNTSVNADLTAECNSLLEAHLKKIGIEGNRGCVMITENATGRIIGDSYMPLAPASNSNQLYYFPGSLKKMLVAYAGLMANGDVNFKDSSFHGKTFRQFLQHSDDYYAAAMFKVLLETQRQRLDQVLTNDFGLPLYNASVDAFMDAEPLPGDYKRALDRRNAIYRLAIGQEKPYTFLEVMQWYTRLAGGRKVDLSYNQAKNMSGPLSMDSLTRAYLFSCLNAVFFGTAAPVRIALASNRVSISEMICKTGTAEKSSKSGNAASSFILANREYTVGVMLSGSIPENNRKLAAKDLFASLIPVLLKYRILVREK